jgi:hypothetical protein
MCPFINSINLNRYLIVWKVNRSLVRLPPFLSVELSLVLGSLIAGRLPTQEARPWRKAMAKWADYVQAVFEDSKRDVPVPEAEWPIEAVLSVYPGKSVYGQGETILWELKLIGNSADHNLFLEVILPAMEDASTTNIHHWNRPNSLWGRFDVHAVYAAHGSRWEPVVQAGKLDLNYHPTPTQWADGLELDPIPDRTLDTIAWLTPFDLDLANAKQNKAPTLQQIIEALAVRLGKFIPGKPHTTADVWSTLSEADQAALQAAIAQAAEFPVRKEKIERAPKNWPGRWIGSQTFLFIPDSLVPYLELASILHLGKQTHFGCGTFTLA